MFGYRIISANKEVHIDGNIVSNIIRVIKWIGSIVHSFRFSDIRRKPVIYRPYLSFRRSLSGRLLCNTIACKPESNLQTHVLVALTNFLAQYCFERFPSQSILRKYNLSSQENMIRHKNACLFYKIIHGISPLHSEFVNYRTNPHRITIGVTRGNCIIPLRKSAFKSASLLWWATASMSNTSDVSISPSLSFYLYLSDAGSGLSCMIYVFYGLNY